MRTILQNLFGQKPKKHSQKKQAAALRKNKKRPIGVWEHQSKKVTHVFFQNEETNVISSTIHTLTTEPETVLIYDKHEAILLPHLKNVQIIQKNQKNLLITINLEKPDVGGNTVYFATAKVSNPYRWRVVHIQHFPSSVLCVPPYEEFGAYAFYCEHKHVNALGFEKDTLYHIGSRELDTRENPLKHLEGELIAAFSHHRGSVLILRDNHAESTTKLVMCVMAHDYPAHMHHQSKLPLVEVERGDIETIFGVTKNTKNQTIALWGRDKNNNIQTLTFDHPLEHLEPTEEKAFLYKSVHNPVFKPRTFYAWESHATFNPAAFVDQDRIHLLYRTEGNLGKSVLGYAWSDDGINFERLPYPVFVPKVAANREKSHYWHDTRAAYRSNSGHYSVELTNESGEFSEQYQYELEHGCEDPRVTIVDDTIYLFYQAYDGRHYARIAYVTLGLEDFRQQKWNWSTPHLCVPQVYAWGLGSKAGAVLPKKVNGKYAVFHRLFPNIHIDYVDDLEFAEGKKWLEVKDTISYSGTSWDSHKISIGAQPLEIDEGYLLITVGTGWQDNHSRYQVGAMIIDKNDPSNILYRTHGAVLVPTEPYEHEGHKWGVAYPCGAAIKDDTLFVYYGGSDKYVCVASANLNDFVSKLKQEPVKKTQWTKHTRHS